MITAAGKTTKTAAATGSTGKSSITVEVTLPVGIAMSLGIDVTIFSGAPPNDGSDGISGALKEGISKPNMELGSGSRRRRREGGRLEGAAATRRLAVAVERPQKSVPAAEREAPRPSPPQSPRAAPAARELQLAVDEIELCLERLRLGGHDDGGERRPCRRPSAA